MDLSALSSHRFGDHAQPVSFRDPEQYSSLAAVVAEDISAWTVMGVNSVAKNDKQKYRKPFAVFHCTLLSPNKTFK